MRRRVAALLVIAALLWVWFARRTDPVEPPAGEPPADEPPADERDAGRSRSAAARAVEGPAPPAKIAAIGALAAASGRFLVDCPPLPDAAAGRSRSWGHPEGATCATSGAPACAVTQPAGTIVVREELEVVHDDGSVSAAQSDVATVYRWDTGPDGVTRCRAEAPTPGQIAVRVVDPSGAPLAGVGVLAGDRGEATDAEGRARIGVLTTGSVEVFAVGDDGAVSQPASVAPGAEATLVLGPRPADLAPGEVMQEVRLARRVEALGDLELALAEEQPPEVAAELRELLAAVRAGVEATCEGADLPSCRGR